MFYGPFKYSSFISERRAKTGVPWEKSPELPKSERGFFTCAPSAAWTQAVGNLIFKRQGSYEKATEIQSLAGYGNCKRDFYPVLLHHLRQLGGHKREPKLVNPKGTLDKNLLCYVQRMHDYYLLNQIKPISFKMSTMLYIADRYYIRVVTNTFSIQSVPSKLSLYDIVKKYYWIYPTSFSPQ